MSEFRFLFDEAAASFVRETARASELRDRCHQVVLRGPGPLALVRLADSERGSEQRRGMHSEPATAVWLLCRPGHSGGSGTCPDPLCLPTRPSAGSKRCLPVRHAKKRNTTARIWAEGDCPSRCRSGEGPGTELLRMQMPCCACKCRLRA